MNDSPIYVIDDDKMIRRGLCDMLLDENYRVAEFSTLAAVEIALGNGERPKAIITDRNLSSKGDEGLQILELAQKNDIPRILMSGNDPVPPHALIAAGGKEALQVQKPFRIDDMLSALDAVLGLGTGRIP